MRSSMILAFALATALGGCKKADKAATPPPSEKVAEPKPAEPKPAEPTPEAIKPAEPAPGPAGTLTLAPNREKVGDKKVKTEHAVVAFSLDAKGKTVEVKTTGHKQAATEVLAIDPVPTKLKVSYSGLSSVQNVGGKDTVKPQILDGKSYVVWVEGGAIKATTADGAAVSPEELTELADENDDLGKPDDLDAILNGRAWKIGETYQLTADELAKMKARSTNPSKPVISAMSLTLQAFDAKEATFALAMTLVQSKGAEGLTFDLKGTARLDVVANRAIEMAVEGPLAGSVNGMTATGTMSVKTTYRY